VGEAGGAGVLGTNTCVAVEKDVAIVKICVNSVLLFASLIALYAAMMSAFCSGTAMS
jgi:hypothetical protein